MAKLVRNPIVALVVFWGGLWLLLRAHLAFVFNGIFVLFVLAFSVVAEIKMIRCRSFGPYWQTSLMPEWLRHWVLGESEDHKPAS
jgi:hypothetical protein